MAFSPVFVAFLFFHFSPYMTQDNIYDLFCQANLFKKKKYFHVFCSQFLTSPNFVGENTMKIFSKSVKLEDGERLA